MTWANVFGRWILSKPTPPGTFTLCGASAQSGEYANMTCTIVNLNDPVGLPICDYYTRRAIVNDPNREMPGYLMEIVSKRGEGALATTYNALLYHPPDHTTAPVGSSDTPSPVRCILKVSHLGRWIVDGEPLPTNQDGYNLKNARKAILIEPKVYKHLGDKGLQGSVVPRYWGMGVLNPPGASMRKAKVLCSVMEDAGECLPDEEKHNLETRARIRTLYRKLHAAGVVHVDLGWRHILRGADGRVRRIDFDQVEIQGRTEFKWHNYTENERRNVERLWRLTTSHRDKTWHAFWEEEMDDSPVPHRVYPPKQIHRWEPIPVKTHLDEAQVEDALDA